MPRIGGTILAIGLLVFGIGNVVGAVKSDIHIHAVTFSVTMLIVILALIVGVVEIELRDP